uniref:NAC domain-containing protein 69 isoform X2 n=1 Tax=Rhizophora mucronata TaxID=61149 RepID=A0A2P2IIL2_RHIMU
MVNSMVRRLKKNTGLMMTIILLLHRILLRSMMKQFQVIILHVLVKSSHCQMIWRNS